jgi:hypothetical protein
MPRRLTLVILPALSLACTRSSEPVATNTDDARARQDPSSTQTHAPIAETRPPPPCNLAVADIHAAIERAKAVLPAPGSTQLTHACVDKRIELWLMPVVPSTWPATDCRLDFYVFAWFEIEPKSQQAIVWNEPLPYAWCGITSKITVALDTGATAIEPVDRQPGRGNPRHGTGPMPPAQQQLVFDAVATSSMLSAEGVAAYHEWFTNHPEASAIYWIWHRGFFDAVVGGDAELRTEISDPAKAYLRGIRPSNWSDFETWMPPTR